MREAFVWRVAHKFPSMIDVSCETGGEHPSTLRRLSATALRAALYEHLCATLKRRLHAWSASFHRTQVRAKLFSWWRSPRSCGRAGSTKTSRAKRYRSLRMLWRRVFVNFCSAMERAIRECYCDMKIFMYTRGIENLQMCLSGCEEKVLVFTWRCFAVLWRCLKEI